jgi:hypothetical protein
VNQGNADRYHHGAQDSGQPASGRSHFLTFLIFIGDRNVLIGQYNNENCQISPER